MDGACLPSVPRPARPSLTPLTAAVTGRMAVIQPCSPTCRPDTRVRGWRHLDLLQAQWGWKTNFAGRARLGTWARWITPLRRAICRALKSCQPGEERALTGSSGISPSSGSAPAFGSPWSSPLRAGGSQEQKGPWGKWLWGASCVALIYWKMIFMGVKMHVPSDALWGIEIPDCRVRVLRLPSLVRKSRSPRAAHCPGGGLAWKSASAEWQFVSF